MARGQESSSLNKLLAIIGEELPRCDSLDHNGHEAVVCSTELRALSVEDARSVNGEPDLIQPPRDCIYLDTKRGDCKAVDDIRGSD